MVELGQRCLLNLATRWSDARCDEAMRVPMERCDGDVGIVLGIALLHHASLHLIGHRSIALPNSIHNNDSHSRPSYGTYNYFNFFPLELFQSGLNCSPVPSMFPLHNVDMLLLTSTFYYTSLIIRSSSTHVEHIRSVIRILRDLTPTFLLYKHMYLFTIFSLIFLLILCFVAYS